MRKDWLQPPFAHLNLRRNPFGEVALEERPALAVVEIDPWIERVEAGAVVEFVGESGRGKSTRLLAMAARIEGAAYVHVDEQGPPPETESLSARVLCVDEAQFLPARRRRQLYASTASPGNGGGLALGTHVSLADEVKAAGRPVESVRLGGREVDAALVREMAERRIEWARRQPGPVPRLEASALAWLLETYGDNIRAMEHHLYEVFQALEEPRGVGAEDLEAAQAPPQTIIEGRPDHIYRPK